MKKTFYFIIIFLLTACGTSKTTSSTSAFSDSKIVKWRKQQNNAVIKLSFSDVNNFYALGIGIGNTWNLAEENANLDSEANLGELMECYVKAIQTTFTEEKTKDGKKISSLEEYQGMSISKSITYQRGVKHNILDKFEYKDNKFVAIYAIKNKKDYFNDYMRLAQFSNSENVQNFFDKAEDKYREMMIDINNKKNKK